MKKNLLILISFSIIITSACLQQQQKENLTIIYPKDLKVGAEKTEIYFPLLADKNIAIIANHTSLIKNTHLVDSLLNLGINITKVFSPEHGFRGTADAGARIDDKTDKKTGLPVISLYGKNKK
ncbi:MAG: DUF1343 domain-containing protein, partial [Bacteroidales bacterium]|nr:DUF1343 domain-containing protein [Bacteroidales bacterium]